MSQWFTDSFRTEFDKQSEMLGRFNLALFGKTGVGKSTLVNAIFGEPVAATGIGQPVTQGSHLYLDKRGQLGILDTQGLEVGKDDKQLIAEVDKTIKELRKRPLADQVHVAWYCVRGLDRRFEESEADFIKHLDSLGLPVIAVLTQVPRNGEMYHPDAVQLARFIESLKLPIEGGRPFLTNAARDQFYDQPVHGLSELLQATFQVAPEGVHAALTAAQQIDFRAKAAQSHKAVAAAATAAAAAAATPIPFSDAALLVPIQLGMMARIAQLYQIRFERAAMMGVAATSAATAGGRAAVTGLMKLIPGAGSVVGGVVGAGVASSFTVAMGEAWIVVCQAVSAGKVPMLNGALDSDAVRNLFVSEFRKRAPGVRQKN